MGSITAYLLHLPPGERGHAAVHLTFLGENFHGWELLLIAAFVAAGIYEMAMAITRNVTLRIPFLALWLARPLMSKENWKHEYAEWKPELWSILGNRDRPWMFRFIHGMWWSLSILFHARQANAVDNEVAAKRDEVQQSSASAPEEKALKKHTVTTSQRENSATGRSQRSSAALTLRIGLAGGVFSAATVGGVSQFGESAQWWILVGIGLATTVAALFWSILEFRSIRSRRSRVRGGK